MNKKLLIISFLCGILCACGPIYHTDYSYSPPTSSSGKSCIAQCQQSQFLCQQLNDSRKQNCINTAKQDALYRYELYKSTQLSQKKPIEKTLDSFMILPYDCNISQDCEAQYRTCFTTCGGKVFAKTRCVYNCDNQK